MTNRDTAMRMSHELEDMLPHLREIVNEIREGEIDAYRALYEARARLSKIVARGGAGVPSALVKGHKWL